LTAARNPRDQASLEQHRSPSSAIPFDLSRRVIIEHIQPTVDEGRFPIKRTAGESVHVVASIFADGHDVLSAVLRDRHTTHAAGEESNPSWRESPMALRQAGTDEWSGDFEVSGIGWHEYSILAWVDRFETWRHGLEVKAADGQEVSVELLEGSLLIRDAARHAGTDADWLLARADALSDVTSMAGRVSAALDGELAALMRVYADRKATASPVFRVWVDRERARFGAWYEMFPRSAGPDPRRSATFAEAATALPRIADLGFDVVYLPPIHPIGRTFRKGRNNSTTPTSDDPGSPWAIGSTDGGHMAVEPGLGTIDDFGTFCCHAERLGLEVALDLAWQCSPDHPWVRDHPEWFRHRPDGTIKYAENPPKKYQDIYPLDFECDDWQSLWAALFDVTWFWIERGVRIFRVDNPHTKTLGFWEWLIAQVHARDPRVIFLSEAFTRPQLMRYLAKAGFTQSYTYFTWRNTKAELTDYFTELTTTEVREYLRPNLFANTPDILHAYLQEGGRPAFEARLILAATLGANYGIYSGFELCEARALRPGSEEYADSEKYQIRTRDWDQPGHIKELIARVNAIRHQHRAFQFDSTLRFHQTDNPQIIAYSKSSPDGGSGTVNDRAPLLTVVNLDPHHMQHGHVHMPRGDADGYTVTDLLDEASYTWRGEWNYVRLDPEIRQGHIFRVQS